MRTSNLAYKQVIAFTYFCLLGMCYSSNIKLFIPQCETTEAVILICWICGLSCRLENWGAIPSRGREFFCHCFCNGSGAHPASYPVGTGALSPGVKWPECEADHWPPFSAKVKNAWSYASIPPYIFLVWIHLHGVVLS